MLPLYNSYRRSDNSICFDSNAVDCAPIFRFNSIKCDRFVLIWMNRKLRTAVLAELLLFLMVSHTNIFFFFLSFKIFSKSKLSHLCVCVCVCTFVRNPAHMQWLVYGRRLVRACLNDALASNRGLGQHKWNANALHSHQTSSSIFHSLSHGRRRKKETKTRMPCDDVMRGKKEK